MFEKTQKTQFSARTTNIFFEKMVGVPFKEIETFQIVRFSDMKKNIC